MPNAAASVLAELAPLLEELGVRWYLFGAQAAIHYGSPRSTADVDVTVELGELPVATFVNMKVLAGRPKDVDDIVGILRAAPDGLDFGEARALIVELGEMLGESDLVRVLDAAATAAGL